MTVVRSAFQPDHLLGIRQLAGVLWFGGGMLSGRLSAGSLIALVYGINIAASIGAFTGCIPSQG
jgi:hypothetical protein